MMAERNESPYLCHVFVCTNDRGGERKSCADGDSPKVRSILKQAVADKGWKPKVRVSQSGCMGLCAKGANIILYPQRVWFSNVYPKDVEEVILEIEKIVESAE